MTKVREVFGPDEICSPFSVQVHEHPRQDGFRPTLARNIAGPGKAAREREETAQRGEGSKEKRALDDAAERLGRCPPSRQRLRAVPIRPANAIRPAAEPGFHADSSLGRQAGWMVRRFAGSTVKMPR